MSSWPFLLKAVIVGADRADLKLLDAVRAGARLPPSPDDDEPARRVLEALSAVRSLRRAAAPLASAPAEWPAAAPPDPRPLCPPAAVRDLRMMLRGTYAEVLGEFFRLLDGHGQRVPPECLPELLDRTAAADRGRPVAGVALPAVAALGPTATWLAAQNPAWQALLDGGPAVDWLLSAFPDRLRLLGDTRRTEPARAAEWLEATWAEESAAHRAAFLAALATGLSPADEALLHRAFTTDRSAAVRLVAFGLLLRLPDSDTARAAHRFFADRLSAALDPGKRDAALARALPDLSEPAVQPYGSLLPGGVKARWRHELLYLLLRHLPPPALLTNSWKDPARLLRRLADDRREPEALSAVLEAVAAHRPEAWLPAALDACCARPDHPVWNAAGPAALLAAFPVDAATYAFRAGLVATPLLPHFAEALRPVPIAWPRELVWNFIGAVESAWGGAFYDWNNPPNWLLTVRNAACHCRLDDAEGLYARFHETFAPRPGPLQLFYDIVRFRRRLQQHFVS